MMDMAAMLDFLVKWGFSAIIYSSVAVLAFTMFREPLRLNAARLAILGLVLGTANYLFKFVVVTSFFPLILLLLFIAGMTLLFRLPIFYSFAVCGFGVLGANFIDAMITLMSIQLEWSTLGLMRTSLMHYAIFHLVDLAVILAVTVLLQRYKVGFMFNARKFYAIDLTWFLLLLMGIVNMQWGGYYIEALTLHGLILFSMLLFLTICLTYAYIQNKKMIKLRYSK